MNQKLPKELRHEGLKICKEVIVTIPAVIYTRKDFYLLQELNYKLVILRNSGLIDFWNFQETYQVNDDSAVETKKLMMGDLIGCFQILIFGLIASFAAFVIEMILLIYQRFQVKLLVHNLISFTISPF